MKILYRLISLAFVTILLLSLSISTLPSTAGECGSKNPQISTDCTSANWQQDYCCFMTPLDGGNSFCNWISPPKFQVDMKTFKLNDGVEYKIDCDILKGAAGTPCGIVDPTQASDCTKDSTDTNSCCYYNQDNGRICVWTGFKVIGQYISLIDCSSCFLPTFTSLLILLISLAIF